MIETTASCTLPRAYPVDGFWSRAVNVSGVSSRVVSAQIGTLIVRLDWPPLKLTVGGVGV
jgi:hypothetical protein